MRKQRFMKRSPRRPRRRADIVPLSICRDAFIIPPGPATTCFDPLITAIPLADGGAVDNILRVAANAALIPEDYFDAQGMSRGLSFLGAKFDHVLAFGDTTSSLFGGDFPNGGIFVITAACGFVRIETKRDPVTDVRTPTTLPNLFTRDETLDGDVLLRWHHRLPVVTPATGGNGVTAEVWYCDTTGAALFFSCIGAEQACFTNAGSGSSTSLHHRVKSRRFLDEDHALYYVCCLSYPLSFDDSSHIAVDMLGAMALRGK